MDKEGKAIINNKMNLRYRCYEKSCLPDVRHNNVNLNIAVTNICNCDCIFCFARLLTQRPKNIDGKLVRRLLKEGAELGIREFNPYGNYGDPFLCPDIFDYVRYARSLGYQYIFTNTNGIMLNPENGRKAIESGFDSIKFSINAGKKETYAKIHGVPEYVFEQVLDNLRSIYQLKKELSSNLIISVSFVELDMNKNEKEILQKLVQPYIDDFVVLEMINPRNAFSDLDLLNGGRTLDTLSEHSEYGCNRPFNSIFITQEGHMNICGMDEGGFGIVADLNHMSLKEAWECPQFQKIRWMHLSGKLEGTVCGNCIGNKNSFIHPFFPQFENYVSVQSYTREEEMRRRGML